jgi:hypothetical protein
MGDADGGFRHTKPLRDERFERFIGPAALGKRADARLQHVLAGMILDAEDFIAGSFGVSRTWRITPSRS